MGRRTSSTAATAMLPARVDWPSQASRSALAIVDLLQQATQLGDVGLVQAPVLAEVRHQRCHPSLEQPVEQPRALLEHPVLAPQHGGVQVAAPVALGADGALLQQAVEERLDRGLLPAAVGGDGGDDLIGNQGVALPERFHDDGFGFADLHLITRVNVRWVQITLVNLDVKALTPAPLRAPACASGAGARRRARQWRASSAVSPRERERGKSGCQRERAASMTLSTVKPKCLNRSPAGALAPNRSMPITAPSSPTYLRQKSETPASMATRLRQAFGSTDSR